ncbi:MAG: anaerobic ribonucleoside-triphosphate reductase activating protein [Muribaculaceae bacterium]|nr:anaerobic ribonucleoside-triphosphate reductase activating protein [Muribaculaceae bacterium]
MLSVVKIVEGTSVDGVGLRTSIYFAGCSHHCEGCHNQHTWNITSGNPMTIREILKVVEDNDFNVTFSGGDPFYQIDNVIILAESIKRYLGKTIWCYTGYTIEQVRADERLARLLDHIDVLVDGRFELALRDTSLRFRGSSNQRIIHLR